MTEDTQQEPAQIKSRQEKAVFRQCVAIARPQEQT